jgi:hypothetical protein
VVGRAQVRATTPPSGRVEEVTMMVGWHDEGDDAGVDR